jgi:hypothetical protein
MKRERWPQECPVFRNVFGFIVVGEGSVEWSGERLMYARPVSFQVACVIYDRRSLTPLTRAAREMLRCL